MTPTPKAKARMERLFKAFYGEDQPLPDSIEKLAQEINLINSKILKLGARVQYEIKDSFGKCKYETGKISSHIQPTDDSEFTIEVTSDSDHRKWVIDIRLVTDFLDIPNQP
ncbi:MAG: hypothetical protein ACXWDO_09885 [Bacteroidia bacterium]